MCLETYDILYDLINDNLIEKGNLCKYKSQTKYEALEERIKELEEMLKLKEK